MKVGFVVRTPYLWIQNIIRLREKTDYRFPAILLIVLFVSLMRGQLEMMTCLDSPRFSVDYLILTVLFYLQTFYLFVAAARLMTGRPLGHVTGVVMVGIFLGVLPPVIDAIVLGTGRCGYQYITSGLAGWQWSLVNPKHFTIGETTVLWATVFLFVVYVLEISKSWIRGVAGLVLAYGIILFIGVVPASVVTSLFTGDGVRGGIAVSFGRGIGWPRSFYITGICFVQILAAEMAYLAMRPELAKRLAARLIHALPFVTTLLAGSAVTRAALRASNMTPIDTPFWLTVLLAMVVLQLCVVALVQNHYFDAKVESNGGASAVVSRDDVSFFTTLGVLLVVPLIAASARLGMLAALFLLVWIAYSYDFYRGKRFFPGNYKIEGIGCWASFMLGAYCCLPHEKSAPGVVLFVSLLAFGGWSLFNAFKDYKDIRSDFRVGNQTLYVLAKKRGWSLRRLHNGLRAGLLAGLLIPPLALLYWGRSPWVALPGPLVAVGVVIWVLGGPPRKRTVQAFLVTISLYFVVLALAADGLPR